MKTNLTKNEIEILTTVANCQSEDGFSEYTSVDSDSEKGTLGSLVKKQLIYNCYSEIEESYMYCLTEEGVNACNELGISTKHIQFFN
tara:strand:+ start:228 stop:488 length:261 start_codon:yes stop_codon:yes gene_type:complete